MSARLTPSMGVIASHLTPCASNFSSRILGNEQNLRTYDDNFAGMLKINGYFTIDGGLYLSKPPIGFGRMPDKHARL